MGSIFRCISEVYRRQNDVLAAEITVEQLQEREQLLAAQNEMLKVILLCRHFTPTTVASSCFAFL